MPIRDRFSCPTRAFSFYDLPIIRSPRRIGLSARMAADGEPMGNGADVGEILTGVSVSTRVVGAWPVGELRAGALRMRAARLLSTVDALLAVPPAARLRSGGAHEDRAQSSAGG
jgi:hypothetical protein